MRWPRTWSTCRPASRLFDTGFQLAMRHAGCGPELQSTELTRSGLRSLVCPPSFRIYALTTDLRPSISSSWLSLFEAFRLPLRADLGCYLLESGLAGGRGRRRRQREGRRPPLLPSIPGSTCTPQAQEDGGPIARERKSFGVSDSLLKLTRIVSVY